MGNRLPGMRVTATCAADVETVYDLLADLPSHLRWAGSDQSRWFRILSLDAPSGPASAGTVFTTTGTIPMSFRGWRDRSTVTVAERPSTFEFATDATAGSGESAMLARYLHRYGLEAMAGGCRVTYTMRQERISRPMLRLALPLVRHVMWTVGIPMFAGRGLRNLLAEAEARAGRQVRAGERLVS